MSSHHSQQSVDLHHGQVVAGRSRRLQRQADRLQSFLATRKELQLEYNCMRVFGFICFAYTMLAIPFYLRYIMNFGA